MLFFNLLPSHSFNPFTFFIMEENKLKGKNKHKENERGKLKKVLFSRDLG